MNYLIIKIIKIIIYNMINYITKYYIKSNKINNMNKIL
jgi:hypothetical protein